MTTEEQIQALTNQLEGALRQLESHRILMQERDDRLEKILMIVERQSANIEKLITLISQAANARSSAKYVN